MDLIRREIKFQISLEKALQIEDYIQNYCQQDHYSNIEDDGYYTINTLYIDSPSMYLLEQKRNDQVRRFSMRIRSYSEAPAFPAFLEKKKRIDGFIHKTRVPLKSDDYVELLKGNRDLTELVPHDQISKYSTALFDIHSLGLRPQIMTRYCRKAYFGIFDNYARVTFDKNLRFYKETRFDIFPKNRLFENYDHEDQYHEKTKNIVLELKCESKVPVWMSQLIRKFGLRQKQFSKFDSSYTYLSSETEYLHSLI